MHRSLFATAPLAVPVATAVNRAGGPAYERPAAEALAQYAVTGCLSDTYSAGSAAEQLDTVIALATKVDARTVAAIAIYARSTHMKDLPVALVAHLAGRADADARAAFATAFPRVVDNARQIRSFAQMIRSGKFGRKSFGALPKKMIRAWFAKQSATSIYRGTIGDSPKLTDVIRMIHVNPKDAEMAALFRHLLGRPALDGDLDNMPAIALGMAKFRQTGAVADMPDDAPLQMLTAHATTVEHWRAIADRATWTETRINLAAFVRHGVFEGKAGAGYLEHIAARLRDVDTIRKTRVMPYEIMSAYMNAEGLPRELSNALQDALEVSLENVPVLDGETVIAVDVSGSMSQPITGVQGNRPAGKVRCIDVAALFASAILRRNPNAVVIPFDTRVHSADTLNPRDSIMTNAAKLAKFGGGGTSCGAPIAALNAVPAGRRDFVDNVIMISDNESWADGGYGRGTGLSSEWSKLKARNPRARLFCIDLTPSTTRQATDRADTLNVGGFSDAVFGVVAAVAGQKPGASWLSKILAST